MLEFIRAPLANRTSEQSYMEAVVEGSVARLRPKLMTVATTVLGLLPIMFSTGSGMDITKPIATPTFGGMITSTIYVLFLIPCLFAIGEDIADAARAVPRATGSTTAGGRRVNGRTQVGRVSLALCFLASACTPSLKIGPTVNWPEDRHRTMSPE
jgi:predicted exporter